MPDAVPVAGRELETEHLTTGGKSNSSAVREGNHGKCRGLGVGGTLSRRSALVWGSKGEPALTGY